jgi:hypothetical protein
MARDVGAAVGEANLHERQRAEQLDILDRE